jgi:hypothetical protein
VIFHYFAIIDIFIISFAELLSIAAATISLLPLRATPSDDAAAITPPLIIATAIISLSFRFLYDIFDIYFAFRCHFDCHLIRHYYAPPPPPPLLTFSPLPY